MDKTKRIFLGIPIYNSVFNIVTMMRTMVEDPNKNLRWVSGKSIHLTISFIGNFNENQIPSLVENIQSALTQNPFTISIEGTGLFPNQKSPNVFWLGIRKGESELINLHSQLSKVLSKFEINTTKTSFTPHITIARVPKNSDFGKVDCNPFLNTVYSPVEIDVNSIYLYESQLTPERAVYTELAKFQLINTERI
jgi:2'-5' RNA ligase